MKAFAAATVLLFTGSVPAAAAGRGFGVDVVVDGSTRPEYSHNGTVYVEALKGREYELRLTNPTGSRVAVALAVDGLNTIDAKHTDATGASKWVLDPYETVTISGWQVSGSQARRFTFTSEERSYGAQLGQTANLGVIEAAFYRERPRRQPLLYRRGYGEGAPGSKGSAAAPEMRRDQPLAEGQRKAEADDYAATGMGDRMEHDVTRVDLELESQPAARLRIRYEFRPQLVRLGVLNERWTNSRLERREAARGFDGWCPEVR